MLLNSLNNYTPITIFCNLTELKENEYLSIIKNMDVIITQPISTNYRNKYYLSTSYLLKNCKADAKIIIIPSLYFKFYYIDLKIKMINGDAPDQDILIDPCPYHYEYMIESYLQNKSIHTYIDEIVNNVNLKTNEELEEIMSDSLNELKKRENNMLIYDELHKNIDYIPVSNYIENNYKHKLLFYSINHPTKYLFQYISEIILKILNLNNNIDYNLLPTQNKLRCIMYKCIQNVVYFDINLHKPCINDIEDINIISKMYYDVYDKPNNKKYLNHYYDFKIKEY